MHIHIYLFIYLYIYINIYYKHCNASYFKNNGNLSYEWKPDQEIVLHCNEKPAPISRTPHVMSNNSLERLCFVRRFCRILLRLFLNKLVQLFFLFCFFRNLCRLLQGTHNPYSPDFYISSDDRQLDPNYPKYKNYSNVRKSRQQSFEYWRCPPALVSSA